MTPRRGLLAVGLVAAALAVLLLGAAVISRAAPQSRADQVEAIAAELRCPTCQALSVADSRSDAAAEIRRQIHALLAEGLTADEVKQHFADRYGEWILLSPTSPGAWLVPAIVTLAAVAALALWLRRAHPGSDAGSASGEAVAERGPDDRYRERVRDELEALDA